MADSEIKASREAFQAERAARRAEFKANPRPLGRPRNYVDPDAPVVPKGKRGRKSNIDKMKPAELEVFAAVYEELEKAWAAYLHVRSRTIGGKVVCEPRQKAEDRAVVAIRKARAAGASWKDCSEAMGSDPNSARGWWQRHGTGDVKWVRVPE